jgi:predicted nucleic acid-binding protein
MIVVGNASPLVGLASIRQFDLLKQLYGKVHIPEAVWQEVVVDGAGQPGSTEVENAKWIKRYQVADTRLVHSLLQYLDEGESESIALAVELEAELLVIDERLGRDTARHFGLNFTGLIGLLVEAKQRADWRSQTLSG